MKDDILRTVSHLIYNSSSFFSGRARRSRLVIVNNDNSTLPDGGAVFLSPFFRFRL
ncbi:hypothetical protein SAMN05216464_11346 [Mucilaginibacter pineti]|uniref:Uncharacterized protein n=1 Tax=Mucilaginibacter pineti TaxID=1391627 RepID=A0A1G7IJ61_9SPHI|nr:hypothetical protein SAMN05216464_11346 [Mucilaginibacter pineti]